MDKNNKFSLPIAVDSSLNLHGGRKQNGHVLRKKFVGAGKDFVLNTIESNLKNEDDFELKRRSSSLMKNQSLNRKGPYFILMLNVATMKVAP